MKSLLLVLLYFLFATSLYAKPTATDSLKQRLKTSEINHKKTYDSLITVNNNITKELYSKEALLKQNNSNTTISQILTFGGILVSLIVGGLGLWISIRNSQRTIYINSITSARIKYIQEIRNKISEFCGLVYSYNNIQEALSPDKELQIQSEFDKLKYLIKLHLNPDDTFWDAKIMKLIDEIISLTDKKPDEKINELITITQFLVKLEWEGAKLEAKRGLPSQTEKDKLYDKYKKLYTEHKNKTTV
jgi:hypothetical protein